MDFFAVFKLHKGILTCFYHSFLFSSFPPLSFPFSSPPSNSSPFFNLDKIGGKMARIYIPVISSRFEWISFRSFLAVLCIYLKRSSTLWYRRRPLPGWISNLHGKGALRTSKGNQKHLPATNISKSFYQMYKGFKHQIGNCLFQA